MSDPLRQLSVFPRATQTRTHDGLPAVRNADGTVSTELSITVTDPRLNGGMPTNIPSLWQGREVEQDEAIARAIASGIEYPSFRTISDAVRAAEAESARRGGQARPMSIMGALRRQFRERAN